MPFGSCSPSLPRTSTRSSAGSLAQALGRGGPTFVAEASGMSRNTVLAGRRDVEGGLEPSERVRGEGGGRPKLIDIDPDLLSDLDDLVDPDARGDPMSPLRWTLKSTRQLARALTEMGHQVSAWTVAQLLHAMDYSLQANAKTVEGAQHPDRDAQFSYINGLAAARLGAGEPVISVDCKKKELVNGTKSNAGREWEPKGRPTRTDVHDFPDNDVPKAILKGPRTRCRRRVGALAGPRSVGAADGTSAFQVNFE